MFTICSFRRPRCSVPADTLLPSAISHFSSMLILPPHPPPQNVVELLDDLFQRAADAPGESVDMNFIKKHAGSMKVCVGCGRGGRGGLCMCVGALQ